MCPGTACHSLFTIPIRGTFRLARANLSRVSAHAEEGGWLDADLVLGAQNGNRAAFAEIYRRYSSDVYRFVRGMGQSSAVADDVVQDVFVAALSALGRYDPARSQLVHYLLGIARNMVRGRARRFWRREVLVAKMPSQSETPDPLLRRVRAERNIMVRRTLASLPVRYREVLVLCDMQDVDYATAAAVLGLPVGTVRSRLHRGRRMLAERLTRSDDALGPRRWAWGTAW